MDGVSRYQVGQISVMCLTDGGANFPAKIFPSVDDALRATRLSDAGLSEIQTNFNCYVLQYPDGRVKMIDTGFGTKVVSAGGQMRALLEGLGIAPADVSQIVFTHLHNDHCGGAMDHDGLVFPNAEIILHVDEAAHWAGTDVAAGQLLAASKNTRTVEDGADLGDGLTVWALPGHTPGHMGLRLGELAFVGDVVHSEALQLPDPTTSSIYDVDAAAALKSRILALENVADHGLIWTGCHMLGPQKFARLKRVGQGFVRVPL